MSVEFTIAYSGDNIYKIGGKFFYPGANRITREEWEKVKKHPLSKQCFDPVHGFLEWVGSSPDEVKKTDEASLEKYPLGKVKPKEAIRIIRETITQDILLEWFDLETRKEVKDEIKKQMVLIIPTQKDFKKD